MILILSSRLLSQLEKLGYRFMRFCGEFGPNADILPDLSCHRCFAFQYNPEMSIKNVLDYPNYDSMIEALEAKKKAFQNKYPMMCDKGKCNYTNCEGLCPALNYYQYIKKIWGWIMLIISNNIKKNTVDDFNCMEYFIIKYI